MGIGDWGLVEVRVLASELQTSGLELETSGLELETSGLELETSGLLPNRWKITVRGASRREIIFSSRKGAKAQRRKIIGNLRQGRE
ncbi:MAG: hypothetical protein ACFKPT_26060 [Gloeotrichia echinulata GP01]